MKKLVLIFIILVTLCYVTLKYGDKKENYNTIRVAEVTHSVFYAPWYVSIENGYFKEEGLDIEVLLTPGADKVGSAVLSGDVDIGFSGPEATMYIYNNSKEKLLSFASLTKRDGQFIVGDCSLKDNFKLEYLKGKSILAGRNGGMPLMMFEYALKEANIDKKEIDINTSVEFAALSGAYIGKQGDFVNLFEPNALKIEKEGYGCVLASLGNLSGVVPYTTFYSKKDYIMNNKEIIYKFNTALNKGIKFVFENDSNTIAKSIIGQFPDTSLSDLATIIDRYKNADSWYSNTYIEEKDYKRLIDIMIFGGALDESIDPSILITNEFNR